MLSVKEASIKLHVSPSLVYALCARGLIVHHRCGLRRGAIRIDEEALEAYLRKSVVIVAARPQGSGKNFSELNSARLAQASGAAWSLAASSAPRFR